MSHLILAYASAKTLANKEIVKAVLTMFIQGATEIYKLQSNRYLSTQSRKYEIYQEFLATGHEELYSSSWCLLLC